jgi:uroporphyrinogen-III synthase
VSQSLTFAGKLNTFITTHSQSGPQALKIFRRRPYSISKIITTARGAAEVMRPNPGRGLKLLVNCGLENGIQWQPDLFPFAAFLAERFECARAIVVGEPTANELKHLYLQAEIVGLVPESELSNYSRKYKFASWLSLTSSANLLADDLVKDAIIVCKKIEDFANEPLLENLKAWLKHAQVCVLTTEGAGTTTEELESQLRQHGLNVEFIGHTASNDVDYAKNTIMAVITREPFLKNVVAAPDDFRVVAFLAAYNEEDIIVQSIEKWTDQGVRVHVIENWSTDSTYNLAKQLEKDLPVTVERFPADGPSDYFDWGAILQRIEVLAGQIEADWFVRRGADEILVSPWPRVSYRDALYLADRLGFNCIDHTIVEFHPVDNGFVAGVDHEQYFKHFDLKHLSHAKQRKAWKNTGQPITTIPSAGHDVVFAGRRIFPFKFLLKHYSFRSQSQAERKVFRERKARWNPKERSQGWHIHYDSMKSGHQFVQPPDAKEIFEEAHFNNNYLVERLSGIGTNRKKQPHAPA